MATVQQNEKLVEACKAADIALVQKLVSEGADINQPGKSGPLFYAAHNGHAELIKWLIENGADANGLNGKNSTPLMAAAQQGRLEAVKILLMAGADSARKNNDNMTARGYAANSEKKNVVAWLDRNPEEVIFSRKVADRTLQEIFNFTHKERVTFIRKGPDGAVEAVTRHSFSEIADKSALRRAFAEYRKYGGKRREEEVFFNAIAKSVLPKPKGAA